MNTCCCDPTSTIVCSLLHTGKRDPSQPETKDSPVPKGLPINSDLRSAPADCSKNEDPIRQNDTCHLLSRSWAFWEKTVSSSHKKITGDNKCGEEPQSPYWSFLSRVKSFNSIESFMRVFNGIPPASVIVNKNHIYRQSEMSFEVMSDQKSSSGGKPGPPNSPRASLDSPNSCGTSNSTGHQLPGGMGRPAKQLDAVMFFEDGVRPDFNDPAHQNGGILEFTFKTDFPGELLDEMWEKLLFSVLGNTIPNSSLITGVRMLDRLPHQLSTYCAIVCVRLEVWHREMTREMIAELRTDLVELLTGSHSFAGGAVVAERAVRKGKYVTKTPISVVKIGQDVRKSFRRERRKSV